MRFFSALLLATMLNITSAIDYFSMFDGQDIQSSKEKEGGDRNLRLRKRGKKNKKSPPEPEDCKLFLQARIRPQDVTNETRVVLPEQGPMPPFESGTRAVSTYPLFEGSDLENQVGLLAQTFSFLPGGTEYTYTGVILMDQDDTVDQYESALSFDGHAQTFTDAIHGGTGRFFGKRGFAGPGVTFLTDDEGNNVIDESSGQPIPIAGGIDIYTCDF